MGARETKCNFFLCSTLENEMDVLALIFSHSKLKELNVLEELQKFTEMFGKISKILDNELISSDAKEKLNNYVDSILYSNKPNFNAQKDYFNAISKSYIYLKKVICLFNLIIIFNANTDDISIKYNRLLRHIRKFYGEGENILDKYLTDIIELNTKLCIIAFQNYFNPNEIDKLISIFQNERISRFKANLLSNKPIYNHSHSHDNISLVKLNSEVDAKINEHERFKNEFENNKLQSFIELTYESLSGDNIRQSLYENYCNN